MRKYNWKKIFHIILLFLLASIFIGSIYLKIEYADESIEEFYFYLTNGVGGTDISVILSAILYCIIPVLILFILLVSMFYDIKWFPYKSFIKHKKIISFIISLLMISISLANVKFFTFMKNSLTNSNFIKDNYVISNLEFPEKKRNLITIYVESLETTLFTKEQGGDWDYEVIPELYDLLHDEDAIYFASDDLARGEYNLYGTTWTTASVVANSTGLPFKIPIGQNEYHSSNFMNGAYAIGDVLKENGYYNELISAARVSFGGIKEFYTNHGNYTLIDKNSLKEFGFKMNKNDKGKWGFNDRFMFEIAKERLLEISKSGEPFNETIIGVDTHFRDGFKGVYTLDKYDTQYENVYATESKLIYDFISWCKEQDFYQDTTIVIIGDHLSMQTQFFKKHNKNKRMRYNVILNSVNMTNNNKNRIFTAVDMYPTILSAMGIKLSNEQMGLGVNLFSNKPTLAEQYGFIKMSLECSRKSDFYNESILGDDYQKMLKGDI